jgi:hypothetical protein
MDYKEAFIFPLAVLVSVSSIAPSNSHCVQVFGGHGCSIEAVLPEHAPEREPMPGPKNLVAVSAISTSSATGFIGSSAA